MISFGVMDLSFWLRAYSHNAFLLIKSFMVFLRMCGTLFTEEQSAI
jgi:hypothetical protein